MFDELRLVLAALPAAAPLDAYRQAIVDDNVLLKRTQTTRLRTLRGLRELYGLRHDVLLFRALRDLWDADQEAQPLVAMLCALARDPLLRATAGMVVALPRAEPVTSQMFEQAVGDAFPGGYNPAVLAKIGRNAASSWEQSGHLTGKQRKRRARVDARPTAVAYALMLGYLCGGRGEGLLDSPWAQLLDASPHALLDQAFLASQQGWLEYRHSGMVTQIGFEHLLRSEGRG